MAEFVVRRAERGVCGGCGIDSALTTRGVVRSHHSSTPQDRWKRENGGNGYGPCAGAGLPPIAPGEQRFPDRVAEMALELEQLRAEVGRLKLIATTESQLRRAAELRLEAAKRSRGVSRHLLEALRAGMDAMDAEFEGGDLAFEARMAALRADAGLEASSHG